MVLIGLSAVVYYRYIHQLLLNFAIRKNYTYLSKVATTIRTPLPFLTAGVSIKEIVDLGEFNNRITELINASYSTLFILTIFWAINRFISTFEDKGILPISDDEKSKYSPYIIKIVRTLLMIATSYLVLNEWGYDLSQFLTGLGITSVAIAFAARETFSNMFSGMVIILERPFAIGDVVSSEKVEGVVIDIGIRSSTVETFDKQKVTVPNSYMTNIPVINKTRSEKRKVEVFIGIKRNNDASIVNCEDIREELNAALTLDDFFKNDFVIEMKSIWPEVYFFKIKEFSAFSGEDLINYKQEYLEKLISLTRNKSWDIHSIGFEEFESHFR